MTTPTQHDFEISPVECGSPSFDKVVALWGRNRRWLGLFPEGAFDDYASKQGLLAATDGDGGLLGYVAFRHTRGWTHIVHLCVQEQARRRGIANGLVEHLADLSTRIQQAGVRLKCRRDFPATEFWSRSGFVAREEAPGRGKAQKPLTIWVRRHQGTPDLFTDVESDRLVAVLDANVFYDLQHEDFEPEKAPPESQQSLYLCPGWVHEYVELCVVDELLNEINRNALPAIRRSHRERAQAFRELHYDSAEATQAYGILQGILRWTEPSTQQRSDMKQVAGAIAADADFFVTRDHCLINAAEKISEELEIQVMTPADLVVDLDRQERQHLYAPARLAGTTISSRKPGAPDFEAQIEEFLLHDPQESRRELLSRLRTFAAASTSNRTHRLRVLEDANKRAIALIGWQRDKDGNVTIQFLRDARHPLAKTAVRHLLLASVEAAVESGGTSVVFGDDRAAPSMGHVLTECGFRPQDSRWKRHAIPKITNRNLISTVIPVVGELLDTPEEMLVAESRFWPLKIADAGVTSYLVPIKPYWAAQLFDHPLASEQLFPPDPLRVLSRNNVYYRAAKPPGPTPPARLLWYVTGTNTIRAASRLLRRESGPAKILYRKNKHLGAYDWPDIRHKAQGDPEGIIEVLEFADTELFANPVPISTLQDLGSGKMLQGPSRLPEEHFMVAYAAGTNRMLP